MINLSEELLDYVGACGYGVEDIKAVRARGLNDGVLYGVDPMRFLEAIKNVEYDEHDESHVHISQDLCILMNDGSMFHRDLDTKDHFEWFRWKAHADASWQDRSAMVMVEPDEVEISLD